MSSLLRHRRDHCPLLLLRHLSTSLSGGPHAFDPSLRRLVRSHDLTAVESLLTSQLNSSSPLTELHLSSILTSFTSAGLLDRAISLLPLLRPSAGPTSLSLNSLLSACNHHSQLYRRVPDLFKLLVDEYPSIAPDKVSYGILIKSHCKAGNAPHCFKILKEMQNKNIEITNVTYTTILDSLYKEKKPQQAEKLWCEMKEKNVALDVPAYNVRVMYKALSGKPEEVLKVVEEMEKAGLKPDTITYNYLISCYCSYGKLAEAKKVYEGMEGKGCEPNYRTFKCYLMALCKKGDVNGALKVFNEAVKRERVPDLGAVKMLVKKLMEVKKMSAARRVVIGLKKKYVSDFSGGWLELEKIVGLKDEVEEEDAEVAPA